MNTIYHYKNYRLFLQDYYSKEKEKSASFTYAKFAKKAKLGSPNYLKLVIDDQRNLTVTNIHTFAKSMNLSSIEIEYFETLVLENQSKNSTEKRYYSRRLDSIRKPQLQQEGVVHRTVPKGSMENVLGLAMMILVNGKTRQDGIQRCIRELGIGQVKAEFLLGNLIDRGEVLKDDSGRLSIGSRHTMMSDPKGKDEIQKKFLEDGIRESQNIFSERYPFGSAKFLSILLSAPSGSLYEMFNDLRIAIENITQKYDPVLEEDIGVYRIQLQAYRLRKNEI